MVFNERDMEKVKNAVSGPVQKVISFWIESIIYKSVKNGVMINLRVVSENKHKGITFNLL